jgi:putative selenium metabolism protein SsnA
MTLVLSGATVVASLDPVAVTVADVAIADGRVAEIGTDLPGGSSERLACDGGLVVPGNVCGHTHLYSALARGMPYPADLAPPSNFVQILQRIWWRLDRALDEESVRSSALVGGVEALLAGSTTLVDHHASPNAIDGSLDVVADALERVGIRSVLCYETTDRDGPERARAGLTENVRFLDAVRRGDHPLARGMVGAHASFTLSPATLDACVAAADAAGAGIHIHAAEDEADEGDCEARFGEPVADRLARAGALTDRALLAHCVHLHPSEVAQVVGSGATVAHNARSNMNNAIGRAPVEALGPSLILGTDGIGSDMFEESRVGYFRLREDDVSADMGWPLERLAAGARFAGRLFDERLLGSVAEGAPADLLVLDRRLPTPVDGQNLAGHWIFGLSSCAVRDVIVDGEVVVRDRRTTKVDQDRVAADAAEAAARMWERMQTIPAHPFEPEGT